MSILEQTVSLLRVPTTVVLRTTLGLIEQGPGTSVSRSPRHEVMTIEERLDEIAAAAHHSATSTEGHLHAVDALATAVPVLTEAVDRLTVKLDELLKVLGPLDTVERDASRLTHRLGRRSRNDAS